MAADWKGQGIGISALPQPARSEPADRQERDPACAGGGVMSAAPQPTRYGTCWHLPGRKPTIKRALQLLELRSKPSSRQQLRMLMTGWRSGPEGPWGAACGTVDEWIAVQQCSDAYLWLAAQLPEVT